MYLVDTNVISELRKGPRAEPNVTAWLGQQDDETLHVSVLTIGELRCRVERLRGRDPDAAAVLDGWLLQVVAQHSRRLVQVDQATAEEWGRLNVPDPLPVVDGLLVATAKVHGLTLVTRNVRDIQATGVSYLDPFQPHP